MAFWRTKTVKKNGRTYQYRTLEVRWRENGKVRSKTVRYEHLGMGRMRAVAPNTGMDLEIAVKRKAEELSMNITAAHHDAAAFPNSFERRHADYKISHGSAGGAASERYFDTRYQVHQEDKRLDRGFLPRDNPTEAEEVAHANRMEAAREATDRMSAEDTTADK